MSKMKIGYMSPRFVFALLAITITFAFNVSAASAAHRQTVTTQASVIQVDYYDSAEPHYGAFFNRANGYGQSYLGPGSYSITCGSSAGCISNWNWWPPFWGGANVLLLPKCGWLFPCPGYQIVVYDQWQPYNYQASFPY